MQTYLPESDSEDELPPGYEERATKDGYVFYVNHQNKSTQWAHPRTGKSKRVVGELPIGWVESVEENTNKIVYTNIETKHVTYTDPRLAFAVEVRDSQNISDVRQKFDASSTALQVLHGKDLSGKIAVITGANVGIGFETAKSLAFHNCKVILACRNEKSAENAIKNITAEKDQAGKYCTFMKLDLSSLSSTREFVENLQKSIKHIDYLILNAGVMGAPYSLTEDGLETTFQVCHLSHFYLTISLENLLDHMSRVIVLSSECHRFANLPKTDLSPKILSPSANKYWGMMAYNNAKLCNVLFTRQLAKKWEHRGVSVFAVHPGNMVPTNLDRNWWAFRLLFIFSRPFTKTLQQGASTTIYCATAGELTGLTGLYFNNCFFCEPSKLSQNDDLAESLWQISEELVSQILSESKMDNI